MAPSRAAYGDVQKVAICSENGLRCVDMGILSKGLPIEVQRRRETAPYRACSNAARELSELKYRFSY